MSSSFQSIQQRPPKGSDDGTACNCNAVSILLELVKAAEGICTATGISIQLGQGLEVRCISSCICPTSLLQDTFCVVVDRGERGMFANV